MADEKHPFEQRQSLQDYFRTIMHTVVGQAFAAAGYELLNEPMRWNYIVGFMLILAAVAFVFGFGPPERTAS